MRLKRGASFDEKFVVAPSGCWEWQGYRQKDGYGVLRADGKTYLAHRFSWQLHNAREPGDLYVLHRCDNPCCINPDHLFLGTQYDNMADMKMKGRQSDNAGENHPRAKLTEEQVRKIYADTRQHDQIARDYGVRKNHISKIKRGELWPRVHETAYPRQGTEQ